MPAYVITYRRPCPHNKDAHLHDSTVWVTPEGWDIDKAAERFEAIHTDTAVTTIIPCQQ